MATVKIYRVKCYEGSYMREPGEGFSLRPWGRDTDIYKGESDEGQDYVLPEGFTVEEDSCGTLQLYRGNEVFVLTSLFGKPAIKDDLNDKFIILKKPA